MGTLSLTAKYLISPNFQLDELESLLSSRFLSLDEASDFTPTLAKHQARDSMSALAGPSGSLRTSLPKSPPSSIAGQFILPSPSHPGTHIRTNSMPGTHSPRAGNVTLPISRTTTGAAGGAGSTSALSITSSRHDGSGTWSREESALPSIARLRRESTSTTGRSSLVCRVHLSHSHALTATLQDLPTAGPLPIRKPGITTPHPFRSSTLSSGSPSIHSPSPSLRQPSPLSAGGAALPSLPARPPAQTSPNSSRVPPSPIGAGAGVGGLGAISGAGSRPSPPFAPSSLSDRRSLASADGVGVGVGGDAGGDATSVNTSPKIPTRKRYSSSFGHRYVASGGSTGSGGSGGGYIGGVGSGTGGPGSEGSPGSTGVIGVSVGSREPSRERDDRGGERERPRGSSLLGTRTTAVTSDEDELSMFVREIDTRKPLATGSGRVLQSVHHPSVAEGSRGGVVGLGIVGAGTGAGTGGVLQVESAGGTGAGIGGTESGPAKDSVMGAAAARPGPGSDPDPIITADPNPAAGTTDSRRSSTLGGSGPMLTREAEIDERLRHMHEVFMASLEGLGSGAQRGAQTSAAGEESPVGDGGSASASASGSAVGAQRPRLGSMRSLSGGDGASSGGSAEVVGRMELDEEARRRRRFGA